MTEDEIEIEMPDELKTLLHVVETYYLACRYPGDVSFLPAPEDDEIGYKAATAAREFVVGVEHELEMYKTKT